MPDFGGSDAQPGKTAAVTGETALTLAEQIKVSFLAVIKVAVQHTPVCVHVVHLACEFGLSVTTVRHMMTRAERGPYLVANIKFTAHLACHHSWGKPRKLAVLIEDPGHDSAICVHVWCRNVQLRPNDIFDCLQAINTVLHSVFA